MIRAIGLAAIFIMWCAGWIMLLDAMIGSHWPNNQAIEAGRAAKALQQMIDGTD